MAIFFDHIGITTEERMPGENWVEQARCWVTNPHKHPERIEFLRYEEPGLVPPRILHGAHIAYRVDDLDKYLEGQEIIVPPFVVANSLEVAFIWKHNTVFEYIRYIKPVWFGEEIVL